MDLDYYKELYEIDDDDDQDEPELIYNEPVNAEEMFEEFRKNNARVILYLNKKFCVGDFLKFLNGILKEAIWNNPNYKAEYYAKFLAERFRYDEQDKFLQNLRDYILLSVRVRMRIGITFPFSENPVDITELNQKFMPFLTEYIACVIYTKLLCYEKYKSQEAYNKRNKDLEDAYEQFLIVPFRFTLQQEYWFKGKLFWIDEKVGYKNMEYAYFKLKDTWLRELTVLIRTKLYQKISGYLYDSLDFYVRVYGTIIVDKYYKKGNILDLKKFQSLNQDTQIAIFK